MKRRRIQVHTACIYIVVHCADWDSNGMKRRRTLSTDTYQKCACVHVFCFSKLLRLKANETVLKFSFVKLQFTTALQ